MALVRHRSHAIDWLASLMPTYSKEDLEAIAAAIGTRGIRSFIFKCFAKVIHRGQFSAWILKRC
jgi:hypothetical protein